MHKFNAFLVTAIVLTTVSIGLLYVATQKWGPREAVAVFIYDHRATMSGGATKETWASYITFATNRELQMITSDAVLEAALNSPRIQNTAWFRDQPSLTEARIDVEQSLEMNAVEGTILVEILLKLDPPDDSVVVLNEVVDSYLNHRTARRQRMLSIVNSNFRKLFISDLSCSGDRIRTQKMEIDWLLQGKELMPHWIESAENNQSYRLSFEIQMASLLRDLKILRKKETRAALFRDWLQNAYGGKDDLRVRLHSGAESR